MSKPIPEEIKRDIWRHYLGPGGVSLDRISELTGVSKTSVFNIVRGILKDSPDCALMRALIVDLNKNGSDVQKYASIIRISSILDVYAINYTTAEEILKGLLQTCYTQGWEASEAVIALKKFSESAESYGHSPKEHADYMNKLYALSESLSSRCLTERSNLHKLIKTHSIVEQNLEVFTSEDGLIKSAGNSEITTKEVKLENEQLKNDLALYRKGRAVDPQRLEKLNELLIFRVTEQDVLDKLEEIRRYPSRYSHLFEKRFSEDPKNKDRDSKPIASLSGLSASKDTPSSPVSVDQN